MNKSLFWIAFCSIAVCDGWGRRTRSEETNNVQSRSSDEFDNGKQSNQSNDGKPAIPLRHRLSEFGQAGPKSALNHTQGEDNVESSVSDLLLHASESEGKLTMDFMAEANKLTQGEDFVLSPFGIWGITSMIFSAAGGKTAFQLSQLLRTNMTSTRIEAAYNAAFQAVNSQSESVKSTVLNVGATDLREKFEAPFLNHFQSVFKLRWFSEDTTDKEKAARKINRWAAAATNQRITEIVRSGDFEGLKILLASATFFKGRWQQPFNITATAPDAFKDENDRITVRGVPMMRMRGILKYGYSSKLECQTLELPYADGVTSMIVFLPRRKLKVQTVLENMRGSSLAQLMPPEMSEEEVDVSLPRFSTEFQADLNAVFVNLNAARMHGPDAELPKFSNNTYISKISHIAEIETSEEGTTASSVTSALVSYKTSATSFQANRPFIYFINHIPSRLVLFSGKISKPRIN